jgi:hypothetical protein
MKGIIVEIRGTHAAVLSDGGCIVKVRNKNYTIGQVIKMEKQVFGKPVKRLAMTAIAAALMLMFGISAWAYSTPYTYVSLDVNPSIEYSVNRFGRVLSAKAVDQDAVKILEKLQLKNQSIEDAVKDTVQQIDKEGYFQSEDPGGIVLSTYSGNEQGAKKLATNLQETAEQEAGDAQTPVDVESVSVGYERVQEARRLGTTPGKLNLVEKLQASTGDSDSVDVQTWLKKPVKDIMKAIKTAKKDSGTADNPDVQDGDTTDESSTTEISEETASSEESAELTSSSQTSDQREASQNNVSSQEGENNSTNQSKTKRGEKGAGKPDPSPSTPTSSANGESKADSGSDGAGIEKRGKKSPDSSSLNSDKSKEKSDSAQKGSGHSNSGQGGKK